MTIVRLRLVTAAAGVAFFALLWRNHSAWLAPFVRTFAGILLDALPYLALGSVVSALLHTYVSDGFVGRIAPRNKLYGTLFGSLLGMALPLCECGMIPVVRGLIRKGLPAYIGIVYLAAGPILNPIVMASTFAAFRESPHLAFARFGLAFFVTVALGLLLSVLIRQNPLREDRAGQGYLHTHSRDRDHGHGHGHDHVHHHHHHHHDHDDGHHQHHHGAEDGGWARKLAGVPLHAAEDMWDMGKYLLLGSAITAAVQTAVTDETFAAVAGHDLLSHLFMMGLAFVLSLCSTADAFIAASFVHLFPPGALLSFLVFGPMLDLKSTLVLLSTFRKSFVLLFALLTAWLVLLGSHIFESLGWV